MKQLSPAGLLALIIGFVWLIVISFVGFLFHREKQKPQVVAPQGRGVQAPVLAEQPKLSTNPPLLSPPNLTPSSQAAPSGTTTGTSQTPTAAFSATGERPQSSFPLNVDTSSYDNMRRFLEHYKMPPPDAVQPAAMVNKFNYKYDQPERQAPLAITVEVSDCPWSPGHKLALIGLQAKNAPPQGLPSDKTNFAKQGTGYVDNLLQAKNNLTAKLSETHFTIAEDAWVLVEFDPGAVHSYRLVGYENRPAAAKPQTPAAAKAAYAPQAVEFESGRSVTALYEIVPAEPRTSPNLLSVTLRYRELAGKTVKFVAKSVKTSDMALNASDRFILASGVAEFGLLLLNSPYKAQSDYAKLLTRLKSLKSADPDGSRADFIRLIETAQTLSRNK